jgi:alcohol dehydrogenase class IV
MQFKPFSIARLPRIEFGTGSLIKVPALATTFGKRALLVTGGQSFKQSDYWPIFTDGLKTADIAWEEVTITGEPSPQLVDQAATEYKRSKIEVVIGVGGGSVLDGAKAIAGLLEIENSVLDFLEGVGPELPYSGPAVPFIAVPTTAGTGSEATKNAVLSQQGANGYKKSFRHEKLVPQYAVVDPNLLTTCPPNLIAANGMDAFTQLLESYVSIKANPLTDALAWSGMQAVRNGLLEWYDNTDQAASGRAAMAYAALLSGITLAQVGLGSVHGLASPLGAYFPIPHGVVCGTLVAAATEMNIQAMQERDPDNPSLEKYAQVAKLLIGKTFTTQDNALEALVQILYEWTTRMKLPLLSEYQVKPADFAKIVANCRGSSMKTNPINLTDEEVEIVLKRRLKERKN